MSFRTESYYKEMDIYLQLLGVAIKENDEESIMYYKARLKNVRNKLVRVGFFKDKDGRIPKWKLEKEY